MPVQANSKPNNFIQFLHAYLIALGDELFSVAFGRYPDRSNDIKDISYYKRFGQQLGAMLAKQSPETTQAGLFCYDDKTGNIERVGISDTTDNLKGRLFEIKRTQRIGILNGGTFYLREKGRDPSATPDPSLFLSIRPEASHTRDGRLIVNFIVNAYN